MKFDNIKELFDKENFSAWVNEHKQSGGRRLYRSLSRDCRRSQRHQQQ